MAEQDQDKTEQATPFKLREARKRGEISKSMEVNSFAILAAALLISYMIGIQIFETFLGINASVFNLAGEMIFSEGPVLLLYETVIDALLKDFWLFIAAIMIIGIISNLVQVGPIFTLHPIKPDIQRINPVSGFKRVFSMRMVFEFIKTLVKILLFGFVVYFALKSVLPDLIRLIGISATSYGAYLLGFTNSLVAKLLVALFFISILDLAFTKKDFSKKMMMSRREVKDEVKRREGDPRVKSKLRELQREAAKRSGSIKNVPDSDILITNPTHISVAISYKKEVMNAPIVLAKGSGELAAKMKILARKHHIPVFESKQLARELFKKVEIERGIPQEYFRAVAKLLVLAYRLKNVKSAGAVGV